VNAAFSRVRSLLQKWGRQIGLEIRANGPSARDDLRLAHFLADQDIGLVLDIGANRGQFAEGLFAAGYVGDIMSFEALPDAHASLQAKAARSPGRWSVAPALALADHAGETEFHVNAADATSSLFRPSQRSLERIPALRPQSVIRVETMRLDALAAELDLDSRRTFLKIDVQGGEALVLAGARETLDKVVGLVVELSFVPLYADQPLALDVIADLVDRGFEIHDVSPAYRDPETFRLYQVDVVLFHPDRLSTAAAATTRRRPLTGSK
jgi:FkbM family methyltransferase